MAHRKRMEYDGSVTPYVAPAMICHLPRLPRLASLASLAALVVLAASCDGPTEVGPSGPITALDGLVTFEPDYDVRTPRAVLRPASIPSPNDTRPIPGSMFFFDPGTVEREYPGGNVGTLIVRYDLLALPPGVDPATLKLTYRYDGEWVAWSDSWVDVATKTLRVRALTGGATYAILSPAGMAITVALGEYYAGYHSGDSLLVHAWVHSDEELASVTATYADRELELPVEYSTWKGWLPVAGVPAGPHVLRATARTVSGREISDTVTITRNIPPVVTVAAPLDFAVANPTLHVQATCTDDGPGGCRSLTASVRYPDGQWVQAASGTAGIDTYISLSGWVGRLELAITGTDAVGQAVTRAYHVYALDAANVTARVRAAGPVLDFDGTRVLYADSAVENMSGGYLKSAGSGRVRLGTGDAAADQVLHRGGLPDWGAILAPDHALFTVWRHRHVWKPLDWTLTYPDADSVYEWRGDTKTLLSAESYTRQLPVDGGITAWQDGVRPYDSQPRVTTIRMRELATGSTSTLSTTATSAPVDVGANRTVVWGEPGTSSQYAPSRVVVWQDGGIVFSSPEGYDLGGTTDGVNTVIRAYARTTLWTPTELTDLATASGVQLSSVSAHGHVAFTRPSGTSLQVWVRTPDGSMHQLTHFGTGVADVYVRDVTPGGTVIYTVGRAQFPAVQRQYAVRPGQAPRYLGAGAARVVERNGELYLLVGNTVFSVN